jgi:hypothetical protein
MHAQLCMLSLRPDDISGMASRPALEFRRVPRMRVSVEVLNLSWSTSVVVAEGDSSRDIFTIRALDIQGPRQLLCDPLFVNKSVGRNE